MKKLISVLLAFLLAVNLTLPALAVETPGAEDSLQETAQPGSETEGQETPVLPEEETETDVPDAPILTAAAPAAPSLSLPGIALDLGKSMVTSAAKYAYEYIVTNEEDAPVIKFLSGLIIGDTASSFIEIKKSLADITEQLTEIQGQLSSLSDQMTQGFNQLQDTVLQAEYTALVHNYVDPVELAIRDSWSGYVFLSHKSAVLAATKTGDTDTLAELLAQETELKSQYTTNWSAMEARWNTWVELYGEEGAVEAAFDQWVSDTKNVDFGACLDSLSALMTSSLGEDTLLSVQQKRLVIQYPFQHQITPEMEAVFCYICALQSRILVLYRDYTDYMNYLDENGQYSTDEAANAAQLRINTRSADYRYDAQIAIETLNASGSASGIETLMQPSDIHSTLTLQDGSVIPVYKVICNADGRTYCIAKEPVSLGSIVHYRTDLFTTQFSVTSAYEDMMASADGRFRIASCEHSGRKLDGLLTNCSGSILLWLRGSGGLTELDAEISTLMMPKITSKMDRAGEHVVFYETVHHLDINTFDKNLNQQDQYKKFEISDIYYGKETYNGTNLQNILFLRIYCDMHPSADENGVIRITQLDSELVDDTALLDGDTLDLSNTYGDAGNRTIHVSGNVTIIGGGSGKPIRNLTIHAAEGAVLTLQDLYYTGSDGEPGALTSEGPFTLILNGTNRISQGSAENALHCDVTVTEGTSRTLTLLAEDGACIAGPAFRAEGLTLVTEANGTEACPDAAVLKNCTVTSSNGLYEVSAMEITDCVWTDHAPYVVTLTTGTVMNAGSSDPLVLKLDDTVLRLTGTRSKDKTQTYIVGAKAIDAAPKKLTVSVDGSDDWYGVSALISTHLTDFAENDGRFMLCSWISGSSFTVTNNNLAVKLVITTDSCSNAGTDSDISAALSYTNANGNPVHTGFSEITSRIGGNSLEAGNTDTVYILCDIPEGMTPDMLDLITFRTDASLAASDWKVKHISVTKLYAGEEIETVNLTPNQWIIKEGRDYIFSLSGSGSYQYQFTVKTGDKYLAGTDSNISFQLVGKNGTTNWVTANPYITGNAFERNDTDKFTLVFNRSVGPITGINIKSDLSYAGAGWYCDYVEVCEYDAVNQSTSNYAKAHVYSWFEDSGSAEQHFCGSTIQNLQGSTDSGSPLDTLLEDLLKHYDSLIICRSETIDGDYEEAARLPGDDLASIEEGLTPGDRYYYRIYHVSETGEKAQVLRIFCAEVGKGLVPIYETKVNGDGMDAADITSELAAAGYGTVEHIEDALYKLLRRENNTIRMDDTLLLDLKLYVMRGDNWVPADEEHFPEDGEMIVSIPAPEGSDPAKDTYYGVHMFASDAFGKTPGGTEILLIETHTDSEGQVWLDFFVHGLSPVLIGWSDEAHSEAPDTGDSSGIALYCILFALSAAAAGCSILLRKRQRG